MKFYLGTHMPSWFTKTDKPLFVSRRRLMNRKKFPQARGPWALDSGGFTELQYYGGWTITPRGYAQFVQRCVDEIGNLDWAAPMDWMCESAVINGGQLGRLKFVGTKKSVAEHQELTVQNFVELRTIAPELPFRPVLQGGEEVEDYLRHADLYDRYGVNLTGYSTVGVGSVCRRESTDEIEGLISTLASYGLRIHGFGVKTRGLARYAKYLASADSMAWSYAGRYVTPCIHSKAKAENNCPVFALDWRAKVLSGCGEDGQI